MYSISRKGQNRIDLELGGRLEADDMRALLDELIAQATQVEHGRMLYRINDFDFPSLGAIGVEMSRLPALFGLIRHFDRVAVLADQRWVQKVSELEGALFPGLEIRAFDLADVDQAEAWLAITD